MQHKIVVGMPAKNEEWIIEKTLSAVSTFAHKIVVSDDQSIDRTKEICKSFDKVDLIEMEPHYWKDRQGGLQAQKILEGCYKYDPDYFLFLDADEIPTPDIVDFFEKHIDENVALWKLGWYHLWGDQQHYRADKYMCGVGNIKWDPQDGGQRKGFIVKNIKNFRLKYDATQQRKRPCNEPINCPMPHSTTDKTRILHYGKISPEFISGEKNKFYSLLEEHAGKGDFKQRMRHHTEAQRTDTLLLKECPPDWFWSSND